MNELLRHHSEIESLCRRWRVTELCVFGSAARGRLVRNSDVDLLVTFDEAAEWDLLDLVRMKKEIEQVLGRKVDLVERAGLESCDNWIIRNEILSTAKQLYAIH